MWKRLHGPCRGGLEVPYWPGCGLYMRTTTFRRDVFCRYIRSTPDCTIDCIDHLTESARGSNESTTLCDSSPHQSTSDKLPDDALPSAERGDGQLQAAPIDWPEVVCLDHLDPLSIAVEGGFLLSTTRYCARHQVPGAGCLLHRRLGHGLMLPCTVSNLQLSSRWKPELQSTA